MRETEHLATPATTRVPWNKGKLIGARPPLRPKHVWAIRTKLQMEKQTRDLALFNLAIDSKLRGCDVVAVKVDDVAPNGYAIDRATVRQRKTGRPVRFELTEQTRQAIDDYIRLVASTRGSYPTGFSVSDLTRMSMGRTRCVEPRRRLFTGVPEICGLYSCSSVTPRSRAPYDTSASRLMTPLR